VVYTAWSPGELVKKDPRYRKDQMISRLGDQTNMNLSLWFSAVWQTGTDVVEESYLTNYMASIPRRP
jgi:hypothetical protein